MQPMAPNTTDTGKHTPRKTRQQPGQGAPRAKYAHQPTLSNPADISSANPDSGLLLLHILKKFYFYA